MPQIDFFAEERDEEQLVRLFVHLGFEIVPDLTYDNPDVLVLQDYEAYQRIRLQATLFFLLHPGCAQWPLLTFRIGGSGWNAGKYAIHQRQGGPALSFLCYRPYEKDGTRWLPSGALSYYATYKNTTTEAYERIPLSLRSEYHQIAQYIKSEGHLAEFECLGAGTRKYWILPAAYDALRRGAKLGVEVLEGLRVRGLAEVPWALERIG
jgi:hypothetical protein